MNNRDCSLCLTTNTRVINITNTYLQPMYEKLSDIKIDNILCWMCFICHRRLQQCHKLWKLVESSQSVLTQSLSDVNNVKNNIEIGSDNCLIKLSISKQTDICIPSSDLYKEVEVIVKKESLDNEAWTQRSNDGNSSYLNSYYEYEYSIQGIKVETNVIESIEDEQNVCEGIKEEYVQQNTNIDVGEDATTEFNSDTEDDEQVENGSEELRNLKELKMEVDKLNGNVSKHVYGSFDCIYERLCTRDSICDPTAEIQKGTAVEVKSVPTINNRNNDHSYRNVYKLQKSLSCDVCQRMFSQKSNLLRHLKVHTGEKPFTCEICQRKFSEKSHLQSHLNVHSGDRPFSCNFCRRKFSLKKNLLRHVEIHTRDKPFTCDICQLKFIKKINLDSHFKTHAGVSNYICDICKREFAIKKNLLRHMKTHSGKKLFRCNICQHNFSRKHGLQIHLKIHSGAKPFNCDVCQRKFSLKRYLQKHLKVHT